ncbi:MAG TPA: DUF4032 domain-containing protein [Candidatus Limnocylindrales bacterium]|nr:DUF4032 domain-containing protein [Candidatus Limnocylindrales bacterium]
MPAEPYTIEVRPEDAALLELDWAQSILDWKTPRLVDLPRGISRHSVRFCAFDHGTFAIKELPLRAAQRDYEVLRQLESQGGPAVRAHGLVVRTGEDPGSERAACLITRYVDYSFSYRELLSGRDFGPRRPQLLDAFAWLLAELHLLGCFWSDCSLSNVLYRYDAGTIDTIMVDAETASVYPSVSDGQRRADLEIMAENVAGEMADIAAERGGPLDQADLQIGEDIRRRYEALWAEIAVEERFTPREQYRIQERINRLNELGFEIDAIEVVPHVDRDHVHLKTKVADRNYHRNRLRELTGIEAGENQARQILADLQYFALGQGGADTRTGRALTAVRWRTEAFEPTLKRLREVIPPTADPVQAYCDLLHLRYMLSLEQKRDVGTATAFEAWVRFGRPGYPLPGGS